MREAISKPLQNESEMIDSHRVHSERSSETLRDGREQVCSTRRSEPSVLDTTLRSKCARHDAPTQVCSTRRLDPSVLDTTLRSKCAQHDAPSQLSGGGQRRERIRAIELLLSIAAEALVHPWGLLAAQHLVNELRERRVERRHARARTEPSACARIEEGDARHRAPRVADVTCGEERAPW